MGLIFGMNMAIGVWAVLLLSMLSFATPEQIWQVKYEGGTFTIPVSELLDVNGDGLTDWVTAYYVNDQPNGDHRTFLNTGCGWVPATAWPGYCSSSPGQAAKQSLAKKVRTNKRFVTVWHNKLPERTGVSITVPDEGGLGALFDLVRARFPQRFSSDTNLQAILHHGEYRSLITDLNALHDRDFVEIRPAST